MAALQSALGISADGIYGPQTRRAVRSFQRNQGLAVDGIAGPATLARSACAARVSPRSGSAASGRRERHAPGSPSASPAATPPRSRPAASYRGKYQFSRATWREFGGVGDPAAASEAEQDRIAAKLLAARGTSPWPVCGERPRGRAG